MTRDQIIRQIADRTGYTQLAVRRVMDEFQNITVEKLVEGDRISLPNFGVFELKHRSPRTGRNPHTGEAVRIPARVLPGFTPSDSLKDRVSGKSAKK